MSKYQFQGPTNVQIVEQGDGLQQNLTQAGAGDLAGVLRMVRRAADSSSDPEGKDQAPAEVAAALEQRLEQQGGTLEDLQGMLEDLWLEDASQASRTWLQRFVKSLPERGAFELLKKAFWGIVPK